MRSKIRFKTFSERRSGLSGLKKSVWDSLISVDSRYAVFSAGNIDLDTQWSMAVVLLLMDSFSLDDGVRAALPLDYTRLQHGAAINYGTIIVPIDLPVYNYVLRIN